MWLTILYDISPGPGGSDPTNFVRAGNQIFFHAFNSEYGEELYRTDGTPEGTHLVLDIASGSRSSFDGDFAFYRDASDNTLYFVTSNYSFGRELWMTDGTSGGTILLRRPETRYSIRSLLASAQGVFFEEHGSLLFNDGQAGETGTVILKQREDLPDRIEIPGEGSYFPPGGFILKSLLGELDNRLILAVESRAEGSDYSTNDLWSYDINSRTAISLMQLNIGLPLDIKVAFLDQGLLFIQNRSLILTDGTAQGTVLLHEQNEGFYGPHSLVGSEQIAFFLSGARDLWKTDGTPEGTQLVHSLPGYEYIDSSSLYAFGETSIVFKYGNEMWLSNGTQEGTRPLSDDLPLLSTFRNIDIILSDGDSNAYFVAIDGEGDRGQVLGRIAEEEGELSLYLQDLPASYYLRELAYHAHLLNGKIITSYGDEPAAIDLSKTTLFEPEFTVDQTIDDTDKGEPGSGEGTYGLYRISGLPLWGELTAEDLTVSDSSLVEGQTYKRSDLSYDFWIWPLRIGIHDDPIPDTWNPLAVRAGDPDFDQTFVYLLYRDSGNNRIYEQAFDGSYYSDVATAYERPVLVRNIKDMEMAYDQDLDNDGILGYSVNLISVVDAQAVRWDRSDADAALYYFSGHNGSSRPVLVVSDLALEAGREYNPLDLQLFRPLSGISGRALPGRLEPIALKADDFGGTVLFGTKGRRPTYLRMRFMSRDGELYPLGNPTREVVEHEHAFHQDLNNDGIIGTTLEVHRVVDSTDVGEPGDVEATMGLYYAKESARDYLTNYLSISSPNIPIGTIYAPASDRPEFVKLTKARGRSLPEKLNPIAIRQDIVGGTHVAEVLFETKTGSGRYFTQDFLKYNGEMYGRQTRPVRGLDAFEQMYDQDLNNDGIIFPGQLVN